MSAKQVTVDSDDEYETEEFLVYVDLDAKLLDNQLLQSNTKIKLLGFDTDRPVMQLNNKIFRGNFFHHFIFSRLKCEFFVNIKSFFVSQVATSSPWARTCFSTKAKNLAA